MSTNLQAQSISLYEANYTPTSVQLGLGIFATLVNVLIIYTIFNKKELYYKTYFFFCGNLAIAALFLGLAFSYISTRRLVIALGRKGLLRTGSDCGIDLMTTTFSITAGEMQNLVVSLDRLLAVLLPTRYPHFGKKYRILMPLLAWLYSLVEVATLYATVNNRNTLIPYCNIALVYSPGFNSWITASRSAITGLSLALCFAAVIAVRHSLGRRITPNQTAICNKREISQSTITISLVVTVTFLTEAITNIGYLVINNYSADYRSRLLQYLRLPQNINYCLTFFLYAWRSQDFRKAFLVGCSERFTRNMFISAPSRVSNLQMTSSRHI